MGKRRTKAFDRADPRRALKPRRKLELGSWSDTTTSNRAVARARTWGLERYNDEQSSRGASSNLGLERYNDNGRAKAKPWELERYDDKRSSRGARARTGGVGRWLKR